MIAYPFQGVQFGNGGKKGRGIQKRISLPKKAVIFGIYRENGQKFTPEKAHILRSRRDNQPNLPEIGAP